MSGGSASIFYTRELTNTRCLVMFKHSLATMKFLITNSQLISLGHTHKKTLIYHIFGQNDAEKRNY